jgi:putative thioredoxin
MRAVVITCANCGKKNRTPAAASGRPRCANCHQDLPWIAEAGDGDFTEVVEHASIPVVVDLWAPWCGPCQTLGPALERVVEATQGAVALVKVNVDENPQISATFRVQSIPAVFAIRDRQVVDSFIGALPEAEVQRWVSRLLPAPSEADQLTARGDEQSLRAALELEPGHPAAVVGLAELLVEKGTPEAIEEALSLLARIPETAETRRVAALARMGGPSGVAGDDELDQKLTALLERVKDDDAARQEYVDLLEVLGPDDPRTAQYRRALTSRLF